MSPSPLQKLATETDQVVQPIKFLPVEYTTFRGEFAVVDGDLVFHFYQSDEVKRRPDVATYWRDLFPAALDRVAKTTFNADYPRLKAASVDDFGINSWWMRAYGFGYVLNPHQLAYRFLDGLDADLDKKNET